jgi:hypothetical protein
VQSGGEFAGRLFCLHLSLLLHRQPEADTKGVRRFGQAVIWAYPVASSRSDGAAATSTFTNQPAP